MTATGCDCWKVSFKGGGVDGFTKCFLFARFTQENEFFLTNWNVLLINLMFAEFFKLYNRCVSLNLLKEFIQFQ